MKRILLLFSALMASITALWGHDVYIDGIYYNLDEENKTAEVTYKGDSYNSSTNQYVYIDGITIPETITHNSETYTVTSIGNKAFYYCKALYSVKIPKSITSIGDEAFYFCEKLTSSEPLERIIPIVPEPSENETTLLFQIENAACDEFELYLMGIDGVWEDTPEMKFSRVEGTTSWFQVTVPAMDDSQTNFKIRANGSWSYEPKGGYAFLGASNYFVSSSIDVNSLMMVADAGGQILAFKVIEFSTPCTDISETRSTVVNEEEPDTEKIDYFIIPNSVKSIGEDAFYGCTSLKKVNYLGTADEWADINFEEASSNPNYYAADLYFNGELLTDVKITSANSIKQYAFYNCQSIKSVELSNSVTSIGSDAFYGCDGLNKVNYLGTIDEWVEIDFIKYQSNPTEYAKALYINNELLTDVKITSANSIKQYAFYNCQSIKSVEISNSVEYIGEESFSFCNNLSSLSIGENVNKIGFNTFYACTNLKNITAYPIIVPKTYEGTAYTVQHFGTYIAKLYVPCEALEDYELDNVFGQFKYIRCIEEEEETPEDVEIEVDDNGNVNIKWPPTEGANSYKLLVSQSGEVFCTLLFNSMGQLTSIDLSKRSASVGFQFTVTGLTEGSKYGYEMTALSEDNEVLDYYAGAFITNGYKEDDDVTTSINESITNANITVSGGKISADADFSIYNTIGLDVTTFNGSLQPGVYVVALGEDRVKIMIK